MGLVEESLKNQVRQFEGGCWVWAEDTGAEVSAGSSLAIQEQEDHQLDCSKPQREVALGDDRMCPSFGSVSGQCHLAWRAKQE